MNVGSFIAALTAGLVGISLFQPGPAAGSKKTALPALSRWVGDFDGMQKRRLVRILVPYSKTIFIIDKGEHLGTAAEWGEELSKWLNKGKKAEIEKIHVTFVPVPRHQLLPALNQGDGDIVAANLTITKDRLEIVDFTRPIANDVREVLVTGPSAPAIKTIEDLSGKELYVRRSSSYYEHMVTLNKTFANRNLKAVALIAADESLEDEDLLEMVNAGLLPFAVVDDHKAKIWAKVFKSIKVHNDIYINDHGAIAAAIRKDSLLLKTKIDSFIQDMTMKRGFQNQLRKRYYTDEKMIRRAFATEDMKRFKDLIGFFRRYGDEYGFDYLMITAQGYQESELKQSKRSRSGAVGIMQIKPSTAREKAIAIDGVEKSAERNIEAGNKYLRYLIEKYINDPSLDARNQTLFAFAAYNAGPGGLKKFRAKAQAMGLDPNVWFGNVENAAAAVVGRETVQYVSNIYKYYIAYSLAVRLADEKGKARRVRALKR